MSHNRVLSIYCAKEDCYAISKEKKKAFPGIYIDTTVMRSKPSLKKICSEQKKRYPLKNGDFIIAIDHSSTCIFKKDHAENNLLHFAALCYFYEWLSKYFG